MCRFLINHCGTAVNVYVLLWLTVLPIITHVGGLLKNVTDAVYFNFQNINWNPKSNALEVDVKVNSFRFLLPSLSR